VEEYEFTQFNECESDATDFGIKINLEHPLAKTKNLVLKVLGLIQKEAERSKVHEPTAESA